jgi:hypothetical protein
MKKMIGKTQIMRKSKTKDLISGAEGMAQVLMW